MENMPAGDDVQINSDDFLAINFYMEMDFLHYNCNAFYSV